MLLTTDDAIRPYRQSDFPEIRALLAAAHLPIVDLVSPGAVAFWVAEFRGVLAGTIGLERLSGSALLRSLAVSVEHRRQRVGRALVGRVERVARVEGIDHLVLLTESAESYFRSLGYSSVERDRVSACVQRTTQFETLCPRTAVCMMKDLQAPEHR